MEIAGFVKSKIMQNDKRLYVSYSNITHIEMDEKTGAIFIKSADFRFEIDKEQLNLINSFFSK
jgi:hypothetical protein